MELFVETLTVAIAFTQCLNIINISTGVKKITLVNAADMILNLGVAGWGFLLVGIDAINNLHKTFIYAIVATYFNN